MIIVIGGTGFIGTYLVEELITSGYDVFATGRNPAVLEHFQKNNIQHCTLDLADRSSFEKLPKEDVEAVILLGGHLPANVKQYDPQDYIDINITGTLNVLNFCRESNINKLIFTTSYSDVRNLWIKDQPISADAPREAMLKGDHAVYSISKNAATDLILHYNEEYGLQGAIFRLPPVYGYGPHAEIYVDGKYYKSGFQIFLEKAMTGEPIEIFGDKDVSRDVVYVKDVTRAFIQAIASKTCVGVYNITSGIATTLENQVRDMIDVFSQTGQGSNIIYSPEKKSNSVSYVFDISKGTRDFGYQPQYVPFKRLLEDYKKEMESRRFDFIVSSRKKTDE